MSKVDFKQLAMLVDDWREANERQHTTQSELNKLIRPQTPDEFRSQEQYDEYVLSMEAYNRSFKIAAYRVEEEQRNARNAELSIAEMIGEVKATWFIVECKDGVEYCVSVRSHVVGDPEITIKPWEKKD